MLSGDDPHTVGAIARRVGVPGAETPIDARRLPERRRRPLRVPSSGRSVFGRVQPEQKRAIVEALQRAGHVVAMTGDGVNDVAALKQADLGLAMGSGSQSCRSVARMVLLDSSFAAVPAVLGEGRRVIANIDRVAKLFVTKTVYAALLAITLGLAALPYPFYPRHLTVVSSLTIGIPGFFLALAPGAPRARPGFTRRVVRFTVPAGICASAATLAAYAIARGTAGVSLAQAKTAAAIALFVFGIWVLALVARPLTPLRTRPWWRRWPPAGCYSSWSASPVGSSRSWFHRCPCSGQSGQSWWAPRPCCGECSGVHPPIGVTMRRSYTDHPGLANALIGVGSVQRRLPDARSGVRPDR